jgi:hypothetical protein
MRDRSIKISRRRIPPLDNPDDSVRAPQTIQLVTAPWFRRMQSPAQHTERLIIRHRPVKSWNAHI